MRWEARQQWRRLGMAGAVAFAVPFLAACGGGGGSGTSSTPSQMNTPVTTVTLTGLVVGNAPIANAAVTLVDRNNKSIKATADANGRYSVVVDLAANPAPYALRAVDPTYGEEVQYSILLQTPDAGTSKVVNITPLTTATVAGVLTSGNPSTIANPTLLNAVTATDLAASQAAIVHVLQNFLADAGVSTSADLISLPMTADHSGLHKVLDEIRIDHVGSGEQIFDLLHSPGTYEAQKISKSNLSTVNAATTFSADPGNADVVSAANFEPLRSALQTCYAQATATRLASSCSGAISASFKDAGLGFAASAGTYWSSDSFTGALVAAPKVVYIESATKVMLQLTVRPLSLGDPSQATAWMPTYTAEKISGAWVLSGDQQDYPATVEAYLAERWGYASGWTSPTHRYYSGLSFNVPKTITKSISGPALDYVVVTGQGLPGAGLVLTKSSVVTDIPYLVVDNKTGTAATSNATTNPSAGFQLDFGDIDSAGNFTPGAWTSPAENQADARVTDFTPYKAFPAYTFTLHFADSSTATVTKRLVYAPKVASEGSGFSWASLSGDWKTLLVPGQTTTTYKFTWTGMPATGTGAISLRLNSAGSAFYASTDDSAPRLSGATYSSSLSSFPTNTTSASFNLGYHHPGSLRRYTWWSY